MGKKIKLLIGALVFVFMIVGSYWYLRDQNIMLLNPKGIIAEKERNLIYVATGLMLLVVIPVFIMAAWFPYRYRESNKDSRYRPDWDNNRLLETVWWGVPVFIIGIIAVITWFSTHDLDPFKPLAKAEEQKNIQVIAMQWKWLFIYPEEGIVSVNRVVIPKDTPISFQITADAPMNSFWIPQLAGQIYAMNGMSTKLHLVGNEVGEYEGMSANISGEGFSDMRFVAQVAEQDDYNEWVSGIKQENQVFAMNQYNQLNIPSIKNVQQQFVLTDKEIYSSVIDKYMPENHGSVDNHEGMGHN
jgi:cytochrome o ubiquinol oxidase subunit 2